MYTGTNFIWKPIQAYGWKTYKNKIDFKHSDNSQKGVIQKLSYAPRCQRDTAQCDTGEERSQCWYVMIYKTF